MSMVWCQSCRTVVWAFDHTNEDVRGLVNHLSLPCPNCSSRNNFDGIDFTNWEEMKEGSARRGLIWNPTPDCSWFSISKRNLEDFCIYHRVDIKVVEEMANEFHININRIKSAGDDTNEHSEN